VAFDDAGEIDAGPDVQLLEDVAQVGIHGVRRDEQPVPDPPADRELASRPAGRMTARV
jgi:hypothetical protein